MTQAVFNTLEIGDKVYFTKTYRKWLSEHAFEMNEVRGEILDDHKKDFLSWVNIGINNYSHVNVIDIRDGSMIRAEAVMLDDTTYTGWVEMENIYKRGVTNENG